MSTVRRTYRSRMLENSWRFHESRQEHLSQAWAAPVRSYSDWFPESAPELCAISGSECREGPDGLCPCERVLGSASSEAHQASLGKPDLEYD